MRPRATASCRVPDGGPSPAVHQQVTVPASAGAAPGRSGRAAARHSGLVSSRLTLPSAFEDELGRLGESAVAHFTTAPGTRFGKKTTAAQSFVWTADTAGQGYGINPEIGGMRGYAAMHATNPDFFLHSGDTIYADNPIPETVEVKGEPTWRNITTEETSKMAETLNEFRGRHRYNMMDVNLREMYADVPVIAQWDDHETTNNWWPGEVLEDPRYTQVRDVDTLAARARRAWQEYMPIADGRALRGGDGFEPARIPRKISRGPSLDVFALDMRTFKGENTPGLEQTETPILGEEQLQWLIRELRASTATWKVIANDLPLGLVVPDGKVQESISNAEHGAPLGRELELARLLKAIKDHGPVMGSPRTGEHQYFGHVELPEDGREFRVRLINAQGTTVSSRTLTAR